MNASMLSRLWVVFITASPTLSVAVRCVTWQRREDIDFQPFTSYKGLSLFQCLILNKSYFEYFEPTYWGLEHALNEYLTNISLQAKSTPLIRLLSHQIDQPNSANMWHFVVIMGACWNLSLKMFIYSTEDCGSFYANHYQYIWLICQLTPSLSGCFHAVGTGGVIYFFFFVPLLIFEPLCFFFVLITLTLVSLSQLLEVWRGPAGSDPKLQGWSVNPLFYYAHSLRSSHHIAASGGSAVMM